MNKGLYILIISFFIISCDSEIDLDNLDKKVLDYSQLPLDAQKIYEYKSEENKQLHNAFSESYSDDQRFNVDIHTITTNNFFSLIRKGFHHIIKIDEFEFKLDANKGKPFVLLNKKLYYSLELNIDEKNLKDSKFIEIDLSKYLK